MEVSSEDEVKKTAPDPSSLSTKKGGSSHKIPSHHGSRHSKRNNATPHSPSSRHKHEGYPSPVASPLRNVANMVPHSPPLAPTSPAGPFHSPWSSPNLLTPHSPNGHILPRVHALIPPLLNPIQPHPPRISKIQKAMEAAIVAERKRSQELEEEEKAMNASELRIRLKQERHRMSKLAADLARHKTITVQAQLEAEVLEEGRVNGLMRRLEELQLEKGRIIAELEREEEMLTNTLQKKLDQVRIEKSQLEKLLRDEKDMHSGLTPRLSIHKEPLPDKTPVTVHEEEDR
eukprot:CAMPEP_0176186804 /NCGR_PEP_ID=MMETSP0121_2-20121125/2060_1 /TAXON_ID=160619 /ORGANISM="Kryptoperidinium foliaceum, Strain CCMP 1326" /LENGTH=287 /DNA_ID=CAMNT_0017525303 /DNA_START=39 /DNA_END=902 /DNA_ORIENTATION=+